MTVDQLREILNHVDKSRQKRLDTANLFLHQPQLIKPLLQIALAKTDSHLSKAAWVLDNICDNNVSVIYPHLDYFTKLLTVNENNSCNRPIARICEKLVNAHYGSDITILKPAHLDPITSFCFQLLIGNHQIAPKVYAMQALAFMGKEFKWIYPELKTIIERDYSRQSKGYQARARKVMAIIKKDQ